MRPLPWEYYLRFPEAKKIIKANIVFMPFLVLIFHWFTWVVINYIISSEELNKNIDKILRLFLMTGTLVSLYNFYALIFVKFLGFPDVIPAFMDFRNFSTGESGRFGGFSDEPGTYIYLQTWVVYYLVLGNFKLKHKRTITIINILSWLFTISSLLVPAIIILFSAIAYKNKKMRKRIIITCSALTFLGIYYIGSNSNFHQIQYFAFEKIKNYFIGGDHTLDSGAYRSFTTKLGIRLFKDYMILGSGPGTDYFYIWKYEGEMGIKVWGERLSPLSSPQNSYSKVLGELGIFAFLALIGFFIYLIAQERKYIRNIPIMLASLSGTIFSVIALMTIYPITSLFLWLNISLTMNIIRFYQKDQLKNISNHESSHRLQND